MNKPNKLIKEKSPYLLQHAYNPVDWYPWSEEAFQKAEAEDKPVFLSIGYSTCHWCHVMEKESFEDEEVAELMNDAFISIKVDREERPDIDGIYMNTCQMLTGSGGWPLTIVMTHDKKPFFAGTYFPKKNGYGRSGMTDLIPHLKEIWIKRREDVLTSANEITLALHKGSSTSTKEEIDKYILERTFDQFVKRYDKVYGGFDSAPKFPTPHNFYFLLRFWKRTDDPEALQMVEKTLTEMRKGGIYDHIGFGFHRYSTDPQWLVPHFEKMLYDQALLTSAYTETYLATKNIFYKKTAEEILEYVLRDMTSTEGGFYSAEDADSEGVEGKFYFWKEDEVKEILKEDAELVLAAFNISKEGNLPGGEANWADPVNGNNLGTNIPHLKKSLKELSEELKITEDELEQKIETSRKILFNHREKRVHPYKDDKILTDWNGLMISAFAKAAQAFDEQKYSYTAERAANFILEKMQTENGKLLHRYRDGEAGLPAHIDDYSFLITGLLDLYECTFKIKYLREAIRLNDDLINRFWDKKGKAFYFSADDSEELIVRQKEIYDGAVPSGNSVAMLNLLRLSRITGNTLFGEKASDIANAFADQINLNPSAFSFAVSTIDFAKGPSSEIIITGEKSSPSSKEILKYLRAKFIPNKILLFKDSEDEKLLNEIVGYTSSYKVSTNKTFVYVCENFSCNLPVTTAEELEKLF